MPSRRPAGSIGELKWDSGSGTYFGVGPKLDMIYILMEQTQNERSRILPISRNWCMTRSASEAHGIGRSILGRVRTISLAKAHI